MKKVFLLALAALLGTGLGAASGSFFLIRVISLTASCENCNDHHKNQKNSN